jgi:NTP pyrophosphatase (non-canonical NTP hydrolase)
MTDILELIGNVRKWGEEKGITGPNGKATLISQLCKTQEELDETADAASRLLFASAGALPDLEQIKAEVKDGIGDCTVTLILAAELAGLAFEECLQAAFDEIKDRKGKMVNGQFVKDRPPFPDNHEVREGMV